MITRRLLLAAAPLALTLPAFAEDQTLAACIASPTRSAKNITRDNYRHPVAVL